MLCPFTCFIHSRFFLICRRPRHARCAAAASALCLRARHVPVATIAAYFESYRMHTGVSFGRCLLAHRSPLVKAMSSATLFVVPWTSASVIRICPLHSRGSSEYCGLYMRPSTWASTSGGRGLVANPVSHACVAQATATYSATLRISSIGG